MNTPTQDQFQKVIDVLTKANELADNNAVVRMQAVGIPAEKHLCGSSACHAGWFAYMVLPHLRGNPSGYSLGAHAMAEALGFESESDLEAWATENPEIWGNEDGDAIFSSDKAFGSFNDNGEEPEDNYPLSLSLIIDHWKGVKERAAKINVA